MDSIDISRVKWYSSNDFANGTNIKRIEDVICNFTTESELIDINDIIELYNIQKFFANEVFSVYWSKKQISDYCETVKCFTELIGTYFSKLDINQFRNVIDTLNYNYQDDFWKLVDNYKVYKKISDETFNNMLRNEHFILRDLLKCKNIVNYFPEDISNFIENNPSSAEVLLDHYLRKNDKTIEKLYFPAQLDKDKKALILEKYVSSELANANYLKLIFESKKTNDLFISDKLKLKAKRKYDQKMRLMLESGTSFEYVVKVSFSDTQPEEVISEVTKDNILSLSYSTQWIEENLDYPTILNNFIYLFEYTDLQFRSQHVSLASRLGTLEKHLGIKGKNEYRTGIAFEQFKILARLQIIGYSYELEKCDIFLEDIIRWFFCVYVKEEFNINGFNFNPSPQTASYLQKCRNIASEMDSILKQFKLFCENGEIDSELLQISSEHIFIKNVPSMIENKYIYPVGDKWKQISHLLFSDQSIIRYMPETGQVYNSFYDLIQKEDLYYQMLAPYQTSDVDWLVDYHILKIDNDKIVMKNKEKIEILRQLYEYEVICFSYFKKSQYIISELAEDEMIEFSSSLFSKPEQDYYNYLFNKSEFANGLDLRNSYLHGTQTTDENQNKIDYFIFLQMMVLIVIKINEEFCLSYPTENKY